MVNILLVDDEMNVINALKRLLLYERFHVDFTAKATDALEMIRQNKYDAIICDQKMPELSGTEVLEYASRISPNTIRILLTAYADLEVLENAINKCKIHYYFQKPWEGKTLIETLKKVLLEKKFENYELFGDAMERIERLGRLLESQQGVNLNKVSSNTKMNLNDESNNKIEVITVKKDESLILIKPAEIYYLVAVEGKVSIITKEDKYNSWDSLKFWEEKLRDHGFFRCHRSYLVNVNKIKSITPWFKDTYNLKLKDISEEIYTSKTYISSLKNFINT